MFNLPLVSLIFGSFVCSGLASRGNIMALLGSVLPRNLADFNGQ